MGERLSAYRTLQLLAERSLTSAQQLPSEIVVVPQWNGIGFSLLGFYFVVPLEELAEMLEVPPYTKLPNVHSWVKGVSNVRGRLLPLFDLAAFFAGNLQSTKKQQRLLVLDNESIYAGLWVDEVFGMQHFPVDQKQDRTLEHLPPEIAEFTEGFYPQGERQWIVFHLRDLVQSTQFLSVAAA